jgi:predicted enzyme related to lactoylglutathione lyase
MKNNDIGSIAWFDLSVNDAECVQDFYSSVVGWKANPVNMGGYNDYSMQQPDSGKDVAGVCHAKGVNADLPAQWMMYIKVANLSESLQQVKEKGGEQLTKVKQLSSTSEYAVIKDPAGAVCAIYVEND